MGCCKPGGGKSTCCGGGGRRLSGGDGDVNGVMLRSGNGNDWNADPENMRSRAARWCCPDPWRLVRCHTCLLVFIILLLLFIIWWLLLGENMFAGPLEGLRNVTRLT
ncbi:hypothetical protein HAT2_00676 [Candidatus Similichlamydia laticola]|uniref:Uncharacterized protein n=1 Tax=Candidatus Similichlamydia laticola TaxID=2170265 RepID=A0A369KJP3_9BACT|nr:hypothetical protein HAT2_00676 [Candidatus Similichlamydia laticola]